MTQLEHAKELRAHATSALKVSLDVLLEVCAAIDASGAPESVSETIKVIFVACSKGLMAQQEVIEALATKLDEAGVKPDQLALGVSAA